MKNYSHIENPLIKTASINTFYGEGTFKVDNVEIQSSFVLTCTASNAYCSFHIDYDLRHASDKDLPIITLGGNLDDGRICEAILYGDYWIQGGDTIINCEELLIDKGDNVQIVEAVLLGIYFPYEFEFSFKGYNIKFTKPQNSHEVASRVKRLSGTILEGNSIVISGDGFDVDDVNDLIRDICLLLRPLTSSEVYFGFMLCDQRMIIYHKKRMMGKLFGMRSNILESTYQYPEYLRKGLEKLGSFRDFDRMSIVDIGYALATSAGCGLTETGLLVLISSLERLGKGSADNNPTVVSKRESQLRNLRRFLEEQAFIFFDNHPSAFTEIQKKAIRSSISRIQAWNIAFIKKIQDHLIENGWKVDFDLEKVKEVRDSLAHSGMLPSGCDMERIYKLQEQLETFLFVHVLDLIGFDGRVSSSKDGWATFPWKVELKEGKKD